MILFFHEKLRELRLSALEYFELAYYGTYGKQHPNVGADYAQYLMHSVIPKYVQDFMHRAQQVEENNVHNV